MRNITVTNVALRFCMPSLLYGIGWLGWCLLAGSPVLWMKMSDNLSGTEWSPLLLCNNMSYCSYKFMIVKWQNDVLVVSLHNWWEFLALKGIKMFLIPPTVLENVCLIWNTQSVCTRSVLSINNTYLNLLLKKQVSIKVKVIINAAQPPRVPWAYSELSLLIKQVQCQVNILSTSNHTETFLRGFKQIWLYVIFSL